MKFRRDLSMPGAVGLAILLSVALSLAAAACGGPPATDGDAGSCVPGRVDSCTCSNGTTGTKSCRSNGTFGPCTCSEVSDSRDAGTDVDGVSRDAGTDTSDTNQQNPNRRITLPIEVIGPDGTTESIEVGIEGSERVERLYLRAYSIGYPYHLANKRGYETDKASVRLNGGPWVDVDNDNVSCEKPESEARCVNGPFHTIDFTLPVDKLGEVREGENTLEFRFNYAHPKGQLGDPSTGYRILDVEFRDGGGEDHLDATSLEWDEPSSWRAPKGYRNESAVAAGKKLWNKRDHMIDGWNGDSITASCADCHTESGYDLQYFAFSNHSIIQRSKFHGLSEGQGKQIAAYIRSIELKTEDGKAYPAPGRPWDPPYQPGPTAMASRGDGAPRTEGKGFDELPAAFWAAGAGLEWELRGDDEVKKYLFPNGVKYEGDVRVDDSLNTRQLPVALQMPDWNEWLPIHHPIDIWGNRFETSDVYAEVYRKEIQPIDGDESVGDVRYAAKGLGAVWGKRPGVDGFRPGNVPDPYDLGIASKSRARWAMVKTFEALHVHHYEDDARDLYGTNAAPLQWLSSARTIFNQAPHITGTGDPMGPNGDIMDLYHDATWYHLQTVVNSGQGFTTGQAPVDWKYHFPHVGAVNQVYGGQPWRYASSYIRLIQNAEHLENDHFQADKHPEGWYLRHLSPTWISKTREGEQFSALSDSGYARLLDVLMKGWIEGVTSEPLDEWARQMGQRGLEPSSFVPQVLSRYRPGNGSHVEYASHIYATAQRFKKWGMDQKLVRRLAQWGKKLWPKASNPAWDQIASN